MQNVTQYISNVSDVMKLMAPSAGGSVPEQTSDEFAQWLLAIQVKYEEASRRGFWRRLLTHEDVTLTKDDEKVLLPIRFQRANSLYVFEVDGVDLADPDRAVDGQGLFAELINTPGDTNFGRWQLIFKKPIEASITGYLWYFATPPKPEDPTDKVLLPGDMIAFGALIEVFRSTNLEGSQDSAREEYENRLSTYLAMESIPSRNDLLRFATNPRKVNRTALARAQYTSRLRKT